MVKRNYLKKLVADKFLLRREVSDFIKEFLEGNVTEIEAAAILSALAIKGESAPEILGVVDALYCMCQTNYKSQDGFDCCGTGGSGLPKLNISSAVALVCNCCGLKVAKHGNRSVTGKFGSADIFFYIGWPQNLEVRQIIQCYELTGFAFLFAPVFYPAMKAFANLRRILGIRTIFNLSGPIANPFRVGRQLVGVSDPRLLDIYAGVFCDLNKSALIVCADSGLDEIDPFSLTRALLVKNGKRRLFVIDPKDIIGDIKIEKQDLFSDSAEYNISVFRDFIEGNAREGFSAVVALNAAYLLWLADRVEDPGKGFELAMDTILSGRIKSRWIEILNVVGGQVDVKG